MPEILSLLALGLIVMLVVRGAWRGASGELGSVVGIAVAVGIGYACGAPLRELLANFQGITPETLRFQVLLFVAVTGLTLVTWLLLSRGLKALLRTTFRQPWDAILGGVLGGAKAVLLIALLQRVLKFR